VLPVARAPAFNEARRSWSLERQAGDAEQRREQRAIEHELAGHRLFFARKR
jgi:hypothetical protein